VERVGRELRKRLKELAAALKAEPGSIPKRLELAAALREAERPHEAIDLYRGVAGAYAEEGRLVQAMAVCKGILDIDPGHRDTLEMLATLAHRRKERDRLQPGASPVSETLPTLRHLAAIGAEDETTPVEQERHAPGGGDTERTPAPDAHGRHARAHDESDFGGTDPEQTKVGTLEAERKRKQSQPRLASTRLPMPRLHDTDPEAKLDFPDETKALARGHLLMDLQPAEEEALLGVAPPPRTQPVDTERTLALPSLADEEDDTASATEKTRRRALKSLESGRLPPLDGVHDFALSFDEEDSAVRMLHDAIAIPFPRPTLTVAPPPFPLLSDLPRGAFMELLARLTVVRLNAGDTVLREGQAGDACYLIASGRVRVDKKGVEVAQLGPGSFFGEFAVLSDQRRHASVVVVDPVELLEIRRDLLDELVAAHPGVARTLRTFYRERLLQTLLTTAPFFQRLSAEERTVIAERFRPRRFGRGAQVIEEGAPGGGLYLILVGEVEIVRTGKDSKVVKLGTLGEGSYFGEMSLLRGGVASATVRATRMTEAVQLPPRDFYEMASQHPILWEQLRGEAERRELANCAILAGEARKSENIYLV
jgi:CRP-like cAMP-binding protein